MLTLDLQILGQRHKDLSNGLSAPPKPTLANLIDLATKPRWCLGMLRTPRRSFGNIVGHVEGVADMARSRRWTASSSTELNWEDVEWVKERWGGKLILKGILDAEDARLAADSGADALDRLATTAGASSTARHRRSARCRRSSMRWARGSRSGWTAASAPGRTC